MEALTDGMTPNNAIRRFGIYGCVFIAWLLLFFLLTFDEGSLSGWIAGWAKWDARWYEKIWQEGYDPRDPRALVFPPGFSMLVGSLSSLSGATFHHSALLLSLLSFLLWGLLFAEWLGSAFRISKVAVFVFFLSSPVAYFSLASYSDVTFALLFWAAVTSLHALDSFSRVRLLWLGALLCVLPWIRLTGYAFLSLLVLVWKSDRFLLLLPAVLSSLGAWLLLNYAVAGDALYFLQAQKLFLMVEGGLLAGFRRAFVGLSSFPSFTSQQQIVSWLQFHFLPISYLFALLALALFSLLRGRHLLGVLMLAVVLLSHNQGFWRSVVRYDLPLIPLLVIPLWPSDSRHSRRPFRVVRKALYSLVVTFQFGLQFLFAQMFQRGEWAF